MTLGHLFPEGGPRAALLAGDCLERLPELPAESVDAVVTDPPYHLESIVARFGPKADGEAGAPAGFGSDGAFARASARFAGRNWDGGDVAFQPRVWAELLRVAKPGAHLCAFNSAENYDRMASAIRAAGWEIRTMLAWLYGTGQARSHALEVLDPSLAEAWGGWGTRLKPGFEPIALARKPLAEASIPRQVAATGTGALNLGACRIPREDNPDAGFPANVIHDGSAEALGVFPVDGSGSAARFFYCAKATEADRQGSDHPTVKPQALMRWLVRLVCRRGGVVLDPFGGSGSTAWAASAEGSRCVLVEREPDYLPHLRARIAGLDPEAQARAAAPESLPGQLGLFGEG